jgi:hypothetical protein
MNIRIIELSEQNLDQEGDDMPGDHSLLYIPTFYLQHQIEIMHFHQCQKN